MTEGRNLNANIEDLRKRILPSHSSILSSFNPRMANKKVKVAEPSAVRALTAANERIVIKLTSYSTNSIKLHSGTTVWFGINCIVKYTH